MSKTNFSNVIADANRISRMARDVEAVYQDLVQDNQNREDRGLPEFTPSYELAEQIVNNECVGAMRSAAVKARDEWKAWADAELIRAQKGNATYYSAETGMRVVESYDKEIATGIPHCVCCLKPVGAHK
jgi:hypothetical protein